tara:strand:+ start:392 stop:703 length:312 start_codon:yes stop_codon:yes gene_type:complete
MKQSNVIQLSANKDKNVLNISGQISIHNYNKNFINDSYLNYKIIDMKNLISLDSTIIIFCVQLARFFKNKNKTIQIVGLKSSYKNLFAVYGLDTSVMNLYFNE